MKRYQKWLYIMGLMTMMLFWKVNTQEVFASEIHIQDTEGLRVYLRNEIENDLDTGMLEISFRTQKKFSSSSISDSLEAAGLSNSIMIDGYSIISGTSGSTTKYTITVRPDQIRKVTIPKTEKQAYKQMLKALNGRKYDMVFYDPDGAFYKTLRLVINQHPEYNYEVGYWQSSDGTYGFSPMRSSDVSANKKKMSKANKKATSIVKKITNSRMTDSDKAKAIHDYIVKNCKYTMSDDKDVYTAYGCLVEGKAVCQGYAAAFNLMAKKAGITSICVVGYGNGGPHGWNYANLDGSYHYIDVTWDDPVPDRGSEVRYKYYKISESDLKKDHSWSSYDSATKYIKYSK